MSGTLSGGGITMRRTKNRYGPVTLFIVLIAAIGLWRGSDGCAFEKTWKNSLGMAFALIPAGAFMMGSPPGEPNRDKDEIQHAVTIRKPFYMLTTEVTREQWWAVMGKPLFRRRGGENNPVVKVSWFDCAEFIEKLNARKDGTYRLPTEAEWEYACRAGSQEAYAFGETISCDRAMYGNNPLKSEECIRYIKKMGLPVDACAPVKSYPPNAWGLYDMHGNVWEWCGDWYGAYPSGAVSDPTGPDAGEAKVRRGGSWFKHGWQCRSANRNYAHAGSRLRNLGFRIVREVE
jgi:formylglycine-generating enzyme required for sulfatase activity